MTTQLRIPPSLLPLMLLFLTATTACADAQSELAARQWRVTEIALTAQADYDDPFDFVNQGLWAEFQGPSGQRLQVPGFWDGAAELEAAFHADGHRSLDLRDAVQSYR